MQHRESLRQLFPAVDGVEQLERALVGRVLFGLVPERAQPLAQFGPPRFEVVILLAKASARGRGFRSVCQFGAAVGHAINCIDALFAAKARMPAIRAK